MTKQVNDSLSLAGFDSFKIALEIAFENGGFDSVVAVCNNLTDGVANTGKISGSYAATEWRGLDLLEKMFPGSTKNFMKYRK